LSSWPVLWGTKTRCQSISTSINGEYPFFSRPYGGKGLVMGWLVFTNDTPAGDLVVWIKPKALNKYYTNAFALTNAVIGSAYTNLGGSINAIVLETGSILFSNGNLATSLTNSFKFTKNKSVLTSNTNKISLSISPGTGTWSGNFVLPGTKTKSTLSGIVLQNQNIAVGQFLGTNRTGSVLIK
jgi:hypothetical protein